MKRNSTRSVKALHCLLPVLLVIAPAGAKPFTGGYAEKPAADYVQVPAADSTKQYNDQSPPGNTGEAADRSTEENTEEFDDGYSGEYAGDEYFPVVRHVPDTLVNTLKKEKEFRYANDPSFWNQEREEDPAFARFIASLARSPVLKWLLYLFLAFIAAIVLYQLIVVNNMLVFKTKKRRGSAEGVPEENTDAEKRYSFEDAAASGDYRSAVRYIYLKTLEILHGTGAIAMNAKATNHQYLSQMQKHPLRREFSWLTHAYEYVWYGEFNPGVSQYEQVRNNFYKYFAPLERH